MYKLKNVVLTNSKPVYVYLPNPETAILFLSDAEKQGFIFSDGAKPTEKHISDFFVVHPDMTINYLGTIGRIAYQCNSDSIIRFDYTAQMAK
ncbi:MAG: hypothetical protein MJ102_02395 [Clostridia bacterium]|nr:hypothetical protein [Clostridia bacterium]